MRNPAKPDTITGANANQKPGTNIPAGDTFEKRLFDAHDEEKSDSDPDVSSAPKDPEKNEKADAAGDALYNNVAGTENQPASTGMTAEVQAKKLAKAAEKLHRGVIGSEKRQLDDAIAAGQKLLEAKDALKHGKFQSAINAWREAGIITFSNRSYRRYMLVARHAEAIKMATVANLKEAEQMAAALDNASSESKAGRKPKPGSGAADPAVDLENQVLKTMRKFLAVEDQRSFLTSLIEKLTHRLELLEL